MSKTTVNLNGKDVVLDMSRKGVAEAVAALLKLAAERRFDVGSYLEHESGTEYQIVRIKQSNGTHRAYLINGETGVARNSRKVVKVQGAKDQYPGYITELPCEKDRFYDPDGDGFVDC